MINLNFKVIITLLTFSSVIQCATPSMPSRLHISETAQDLRICATPSNSSATPSQKKFNATQRLWNSIKRNYFPGFTSPRNKSYGNLSELQRAIDDGADVNAQENADLFSPINRLSSPKGIVSPHNGETFTPLSYLVTQLHAPLEQSEGILDLIACLLNNGADPNIYVGDNRNLSVLHKIYLRIKSLQKSQSEYAAKYDHNMVEYFKGQIDRYLKVFQYILIAGGNINIPLNEIYTCNIPGKIELHEWTLLNYLNEEKDQLFLKLYDDYIIKRNSFDKENAEKIASVLPDQIPFDLVKLISQYRSMAIEIAPNVTLSENGIVSPKLVNRVASPTPADGISYEINSIPEENDSIHVVGVEPITNGVNKDKTKPKRKCVVQ